MKSRLLHSRISAFIVSIVFIISAGSLHAQTAESYVPALQATAGADLGLALVNPTLAEARVTLTARSYNGAVIQAEGITNPVSLTLPASGQLALRAAELFGSGISGQAGWVEISPSTPAVKGFFMSFDSALSFIDGAELARPASRLVFAKVSGSGSPTVLTLVNTAAQAVNGTISLYRNDGQLFAAHAINLPAFSGFNRAIDELLPSAVGFDGYVVVQTVGAGPESLIGVETYRNHSDIALIRALPESARRRTGFLPHLAVHGGYLTTLTMVNSSDQSQVLQITADGLESGGSARNPSSVTVMRTLAPHARLEEPVDAMFNLTGDDFIGGYIRFETQSDTPGVMGFIDYGTTDGTVLSAVEAQGAGYSNLFFSHVAEGAGYYTGLAVLNSNTEPSIVTLDTFDSTGSRTGSTVVNLNPGERRAHLLSEFLERQVTQLGGYIRLTATRPISAFELFGSRDALTFLASVPAQGEALKPQESGREIDASVGANVISDDGSASVLVPPKALKKNASIKIKRLNLADLPQPAADQEPVLAVEATPAGTQFDIPVRLTFPLNADLDPGTRIPLLIFDPATRKYHQTEFTAIVDNSGRTASAEVTHFTQYVGTLGVGGVTISSITPSTVSPGQTVTITGNGFRTPITVTFAGPNNTSLRGTVLSSTFTSIEAVVPNGAVSGPVIVKAWKQTSTGYFITVASSNPAPGTILISPTTTPAGSSVDVQVSGTSFVNNSVVNYDGNPLSTRFMDQTLLVVTLQSAQLTSGIHKINVFTPAPGGGTSNTVDLTVTAAAPPPTNRAPVVNAGSDQTITLPASANLGGTATDDGLPTGSTLTTMWSKVSGPGTVTFANASARSTTATFSASGNYVLRLTASDSALTATDDVAIVVSPAAPLPPSALMAAYGFNEGSGTQTSSSSSGATATLNSASWTTGKFGNAVSFNGVSSYVDAPAVSPATAATFEAWVYLNGAPTELVSVLNKWSQSVDDEYLMGINVNGTLFFAWQTTGSTGSYWNPSFNEIAGVAAIPLNTLTHVAVVRDGVNLKFYINGSLDISVDAMDTNPFRSGANTLRIGGQTRGGVGRYLNGKIDEVRIYNRALTPAEIQSDMATPIGSGTAPAPPPTNRAPTVSAGSDQTITLPASATLNGSVTDDGLPTGSALTTTWSKVSGPGTVTFVNASARSTTASFSASGSYVLRLTASDSALTATDDVTIVVNPAGAFLPPPGLIAAYSFNEGSGSQTLGAFGGAAILNSASWTTGKFGNAISFDGVSSYVEAPAVSPGTTATFETWVYLDAAPTEVVSVLNKWSQSIDDEYLLGITPSRTLFFAWQTTGSIGADSYGSPSYNEVGGGATIPLNTLTHIAVVRDGVNIKFYINGSLDISVDAIDTNPFRTGANSLRIGGQTRGGVNRYLDGKIDEVRIYNRALTPAEIQSDMATPIGSGTAPAPPPSGPPVVRGTITVSATATDDVGVVGVQFKLDGVNLGSEITSGSYSISWNTAGVANSNHTLTAVARDAAGNLGTSPPLVVTVGN